MLPSVLHRDVHYGGPDSPYTRFNFVTIPSNFSTFYTAQDNLLLT